jgi:anthranilate synthase component 2
MQITIIDNYDSFTYNLVHYFEMNEVIVTVMKNDEVDFEKLDMSDAIVLSPGPGLPAEAGDLMKVISMYHGKKTLFGVCLGMQAIGLFYGEQLVNQKVVKHGLQESIFKTSDSCLFNNISFPTKVGLYHSWCVQLVSSSKLKSTSISENNILMSFEDVLNKVYGVQFHPESIMTEEGRKIIANFLEVVRENLDSKKELI